MSLRGDLCAERGVHRVKSVGTQGLNQKTAPFGRTFSFSNLEPQYFVEP